MPTKEETILSQSKNDYFIVIEDWMLTQLHLEGMTLLVYAVIYGFCKKDNQYLGGYSYFMERFDFNKMAVYRSLQKLTTDGLIIERKEKRRKIYTIGNKMLPNGQVTKCYPTGNKMLPQKVTKCYPEGNKMLPKTKIDINKTKECSKDNTHARKASVIADEILKAMEAP